MLVSRREDENTINQIYETLPDNPPSGYRELLIAREGLSQPVERTDPEGNRVTLVPPGNFGIERIGIRLAVRDVEAHAGFYREALGLSEIAPRELAAGARGHFSPAIRY
jgi:lactoylglutathione lyase